MRLRQALVVIAAVEDLGGGVGIHLTVADQQLIQDVLLAAAYHIVGADGVDALQRVGDAVHLHAYGEDIADIAADSLHLALGGAGAHRVLGDAALTR